MSEALANGAHALVGGKRADVPGAFFEPTVLVDVDQSMSCMRQETFGPTLPVMKVTDVEEARAARNKELGETRIMEEIEKGYRSKLVLG